MLESVKYKKNFTMCQLCFKAGKAAVNGTHLSTLRTGHGDTSVSSLVAPGWMTDASDSLTPANDIAIIF